MQQPLLLLTGATGKVGQHFIQTALRDPRFDEFNIRALCHQRRLPQHPRVDMIHGTITDRALVHEAMHGATHVLHLATCKEIPEDVVDVTVKGLFWLLEEARQSSDFQQFILIGGDAAIGHFHNTQKEPLTEEAPFAPYPGCYALSKVLEEVMLSQYYTTYDLNGCCLRAPWIMEKDDFKYQLSFGDDVFGGPRWCDIVSAEQAQSYLESNTIPIMLDKQGAPITRNFVHVFDLVDAILCSLDHPNAKQQCFHICTDEPINYGKLAEYLQQTRKLPSVPISTSYYSTWLDNSKAKHLLGWRPRYDMQRLADEAFDYQRVADEPRKIYYPG